MAATPTAERIRTSDVPSRRLSASETKPSFKTTEMPAMIAAVAAILIASAVADNFDAPRAWTLVAVVVSAYMVARGLAKSGSRHSEDGDYR